MINKLLLILIFICILYFIYNSCKQREDFKIVIKKKSKKIKSENSVLEGKLILITGATGGIGRQLSKKLSSIGCKLIIHGRDKHKVNKLESELKKFNPHIIGITADLSNEEEVDNMISEITKSYPEIYALINNAASQTGSKELTSKNFKDWKKDMSVNIDTTFYLTNKIINHMRNKSVKGRIINVSGYTAKTTESIYNDGGTILSKSFIEKFSEILAEENFDYKIAVTTLRIDEVINTINLDNLENIPIYGKRVKKSVDNISKYLIPSPSKIIPVFLYALRAPFHEISGKLISTNAYLSNPKLSKIIPSHQINLNDNVYSNLLSTKAVNLSKDKETTYLVKQNPYGMSPKVKKIIQNSDLDNKAVNTNTKYIGDLDSIIARDLNIDKRQITFFKTEYDAMKKLVELFVTKYQDIMAIYPCWNYLFIVSKEQKINLKYFTFKSEGKNLQPNLKQISEYINQKTKMIYLTSPNSISGQSINKEEFDKFIKSIPDNIPIVIDQSYVEFSDNKDALNPLDYLDKNVIVLRSMNNFYGFENLELSYVISDIDIANMLQKSQIIDMPLNRLNEEIALTAYQDKNYNNYIKSTIKKERERLYKIFKDNKIEYYPSEVNFVLIKPNNNTKTEIEKKLEKNKIILYASNDVYGSFWTLPIHKKSVNNKVLQCFDE